MKKIFLFLVLLILIPINCFAQDIGIYDVTLKGASSAKEGEYYTVDLSGTYSGLDPNSFGVHGIFAVAAEFEFDDSVLVVTDFFADGYDSEIKYDDEDDCYYSLSIVDNLEKNKCADKFLNCTPYNAKLTFFVKDTDAESTTIKFNGLSIISLVVNDHGGYDEDDILEIDFEKSRSIKVDLKQSSGEFKVPNSALSDSISSINSSTLNKAINNNDNIVTDGSGKKDEENKKDESDNSPKEGSKLFLKDIKIKNHKIDFSNTKSTYEIVLDSTTNKLDIEAIPYYKDTTIKIVGADNLKGYSDIVKVRVELSNHEKMTYIININRENLSDAESASIINKLNYVGFGILGVVVFIVMIVLIASSNDKRKLRKLLAQSKKNEMI